MDHLSSCFACCARKNLWVALLAQMSKAHRLAFLLAQGNRGSHDAWSLLEILLLQLHCFPQFWACCLEGGQESRQCGSAWFLLTLSSRRAAPSSRQWVLIRANANACLYFLLGPRNEVVKPTSDMCLGTLPIIWTPSNERGDLGAACPPPAPSSGQWLGPAASEPWPFPPGLLRQKWSPHCAGPRCALGRVWTPGSRAA